MLNNINLSWLNKKLDVFKFVNQLVQYITASTPTAWLGITCN